MSDDIDPGFDGNPPSLTPWMRPQPSYGDIIGNILGAMPPGPAIGAQALPLAAPANAPAVQPVASNNLFDQTRNWLQQGHDAFQGWLNQPTVDTVIKGAISAGQAGEEVGEKTQMYGAGAAGVGGLSADPVLGAAGLATLGLGADITLNSKVLDSVASWLQSLQQGRAAPLANSVPRTLKPDLDAPGTPMD